MELTGSSAFDYIHPGDHVETAEQLGMKLPPGRGMSLSQGAVNEDAASSASSSSHPETPEPGGKVDRRKEGALCPASSCCWSEMKKGSLGKKTKDVNEKNATVKLIQSGV